jgi:hypothetical protein
MQPQSGTLRFSQNLKRTMMSIAVFKQDVVYYSLDQVFGSTKFERVPIVNFLDLFDIPE